MKRAKPFVTIAKAPAPEWEEFARAAWPGRVPLPVANVFGRLNLTLLILGVVVGLSAAWMRSPWLALCAWAVPALADWLATRSDHPTTRLLNSVGLHAQARGMIRSILAAAAVLIAVAPNAVNAGLSYVSVALAVHLAWLMQPMLARWTWRSAPAVQYVPQATDQPHWLRRYVSIYARAVGAPVVLTLIELCALVDAVIAEYRPAGTNDALLGLTIAGALGETALLYAGWTAWQAHAARRDATKIGDQLRHALAEREPTFIVHISAPARRAARAANPWSPLFDAAPDHGIVVVRQASQLADLVHGRHPVIYAPKDLQATQFLDSGIIRAVFYPVIDPGNAALLADPRPRHILLADGDCDQAAMTNNLARGMDEVWVPGKAAAERFERAGVDLSGTAVVEIGRPQLAELSEGPTGNARTVVLYAPTFEGDQANVQHTSIGVQGVRLVKRLLRKYPDVEIWFRPDPFTAVHESDLLVPVTEITTVLRAARNGHRVVSDLTELECLAGADVLISDVSPLGMDFLATGRPIITCDVDGETQAEFVAAYPTQAAAYLIGPNLEGLDQAMSLALGDDPLRSARQVMGQRVLGELSAAEFDRQLHRVLHENHDAAPVVRLTS